MQLLLNRFSAFFAVVLLVVSIALPTYAQGRNTEARFVLDFVTDHNDSQTSSSIEITPQFFQDNGATYFLCTLVLLDSVDLMGLSCNIRFDNSVLRVDDIFEIPGDMNFDGRSNIADILTLGERLGIDVSEHPELALYDLAGTGFVDRDDIDILRDYLNLETLYWTQNPNTSDFDIVRESVTLFEDPEASNAKGIIEDIASVLLRRPETPIEGFGFTGDARVATIVFEIIGGETGQSVVLSLEDGVVLDEGTAVNSDGSLTNASQIESTQVEIALP